MLTGWIAGGLAQVAIVLSALMGGVSGSAVAEAAMEARILGPAMLKAGYTKGYTCATIAVGALITATIPPSIGLILYGFMGNVSIGQLFAGGIIPGLLMTVFLMFTAWLIARKRGYKPAADRLPTAWEVLCNIWDCKWALLFPVFLILGIRYGIFTPSEAGAFAVAYAIFIGFFVYRELTVAEADRIAAPEHDRQRHDHADHHVLGDDRLHDHAGRRAADRDHLPGVDQQQSRRS